MYANVVRIQIQAGKLDEALSIFFNSVLPVVKEQTGYKDAHILVDREASRFLGINFWETEADLSALGTNDLYQEQVAKFAALFAGPPEFEGYEVASL